MRAGIIGLHREADSGFRWNAVPFKRNDVCGVPSPGLHRWLPLLMANPIARMVRGYYWLASLAYSARRVRGEGRGQLHGLGCVVCRVFGPLRAVATVRRQVPDFAAYVLQALVRHDLQKLSCPGWKFSRRRWRRASKASLTCPSRRGHVKRFAVATASWIARLIPTPPPATWRGPHRRCKQARPIPRSRRLICTDRSLTWSQSLQLARPLTKERRDATDRLVKCRQAAGLICSKEPLRMTSGRSGNNRHDGISDDQSRILILPKSCSGSSVAAADAKPKYIDREHRIPSTLNPRARAYVECRPSQPTTRSARISAVPLRRFGRPRRDSGLRSSTSVASCLHEQIESSDIAWRFCR